MKFSLRVDFFMFGCVVMMIICFGCRLLVILLSLVKLVVILCVRLLLEVMVLILFIVGCSRFLSVIKFFDSC